MKTTDAEIVHAHPDNADCGCDGCRIGYRIDRSREHIHTCLNCDNVVGIGSVGCEINEDHDYTLCDDCTNKERL